MSPEEQLAIYEKDTNAEANIRKAITEAYQDLKPESELVHTYENSQFPSFYSTLNGYGTGAADLSPTAQLQNAWGEVGRRSTSANVARDVFDVRRAGMEDLIKSGMNQWQQGYTGAQNSWQRWWAQKQHEDQMRIQRAQIAAMNVNRPTPTPTPTPVDPQSIIDAYNRSVLVGNSPEIIRQTQADIADRSSGFWAKTGNNLINSGNILRGNYNELIKPNITGALSNLFKR